MDQKRAEEPPYKTQVEEAVEAEQGRWQVAIYELILGRLGQAGLTAVLDGAGCESGDPLEVTLAEIEIGFSAFADALAASGSATRNETQRRTPELGAIHANGGHPEHVPQCCEG